MDKEKFVRVTNIANSRVVYTVPPHNIRREYPIGATLLIPKEEFEQTAFFSDTRRLFEKGYLRCLDKQMLEEVGLIVPADTVPKNSEVDPVSIALSEEEIRNRINGGDMTDILKMCKGATAETKEIIRNILITEKRTEQGFIKIAKTHLGLDLMKAVQLQEEPESDTDKKAE